MKISKNTLEKNDKFQQETHIWVSLNSDAVLVRWLSFPINVSQILPSVGIRKKNWIFSKLTSKLTSKFIENTHRTNTWDKGECFWWLFFACSRNLVLEEESKRLKRAVSAIFSYALFREWIKDNVLLMN